MRTETHDPFEAEAIAWRIRLRDGDDATWEAFATWLAKDPRHARAYDAVEETDLALEALLPHLVLPDAANDTAPPVRPRAGQPRRWLWAGGAVAASILTGLIVVPQFSASRYEVVTLAGERRVVTLDADTVVTLNGATRMTFDRRNPRYAALALGEAHFRVRHDTRSPFRLEVAGRIVEDAGTIFNVAYDARQIRVGVAEGKVVYDAERTPTLLNPGQQLVQQEGGKAEISEVPAALVGSWTNGALAYSGAALSQVAADLGRALGVRIVVAPAIADRPFTGAIRLDGRGIEQLKRLEPALNVRLVETADGWRMDPVVGAAR